GSDSLDVTRGDNLRRCGVHRPSGSLGYRSIPISGRGGNRRRASLGRQGVELREALLSAVQGSIEPKGGRVLRARIVQAALDRQTEGEIVMCIGFGAAGFAELGKGFGVAV